MKLEEIKELIRVFGRSKLGELEIQDGDFKVSMVREEEGNTTSIVAPAAVPAPEPVAVAAIPAPLSAEAPAKTQEPLSGDIIASPMVGTFYASPSPDSPIFVKAGDTARKGQVLCILEAMKIMNELEAEYDCKILEVLVKDGQPIEYDMPLFRVEKI